eukprot:2441026-Prymnesium_polylepis.1
MGGSDAALRQRLIERENALSAAIAAAAHAHGQHEEEMGCLSAKIRQLEDERVRLQVALVQQASDLEVLMQAVPRSAHAGA